MAYIGRDVSFGLFETQTLTADGSTTTFALDWYVGAAGSILVVYGGVIQQPAVAYSISSGGSSITFSEAPASGTTLYIVYMGKQLTVARTAGQETSTESFTGDGSTTSFTLTDPPVIPAGVMVFVDGILQKEGSGNNYVSSGSTIVFSTAPDSSAEIDVYTLVKEKVSIDTVTDNVLTRAKMASTLQRNVIGAYSIINTNTTASAGGYYFVDTSGGAVTLTLPTIALLGDTIRIIDMSGTFDTNNLTVARNSHKIQRDTADLTVDTEGAAFDLIYSNATNGWLLFSV